MKHAKRSHSKKGAEEPSLPEQPLAGPSGAEQTLAQPLIAQPAAQRVAQPSAIKKEAAVPSVKEKQLEEVSSLPSSQKTLPDLTSDLDLPLFLPSQIGPYKIESLFNKGGMSLLYLATHPETNRPVIIKILSPKYIKNPDVVNRFLQEARIISMTHHPNIVQLLGQGRWEKGLYIAMEFVRGISLRQFMRRQSFSLKKALEIILQVAYALCHLHTHGVIHRDLKPENILITENGDIKVIDFGIARLLEAEPKEMKKMGKTIGTPSYMSPEQKKDPTSVTFSSDIYSLAIILYELIIGQLSHGIVHLDLIPKSLRPILEKCLDPDPKKRYQDIVDFITDISAYLKNFDEKKEDFSQFDTVFEFFRQSTKDLFPASFPSFSTLECKVTKEDNISLTGTYLDLFKFSENTFVIFLAEPKNVGMKTLFPLAQLKGMLRVLVMEPASIEVLLPKNLLTKLNQNISSRSEGVEYSFLYLFLHHESNQIHFATDNASLFFHLPKEGKKLSPLSTPNPALGSVSQAIFSQTSMNWNISDKLLIATKILQPILSKLDQKNSVEFSQRLLYPMSNLGGKVLELASKYVDRVEAERMVALINFERKY